MQDCYHAGNTPDHEIFDMVALYGALSLAQISESDIDLVTTNTKTADPGKFKNKRK